MIQLNIFKETATSKSEVPGAGIADVQLQLYNLNSDCHNAHSNMCLSQELPNVRVSGNGVKQNGTSDDSHKVQLYWVLFITVDYRDVVNWLRTEN